MEVFRKFSNHFLQIFAKKKGFLALVLFSRDGQVITNIFLFSALLKCVKGELYFPLKNIYLYNLWYLAVLKTLYTHGGVILTLSFPGNIIFPEKLLLKLYPISLLAIKGMVYFKSHLTLSKTTGYLLMSLVTHKEGDFFLLHLFVVLSSLFSLFKLTMACYWLFHFLPATTSQNVLTYKLTLNQLLQRKGSVIIKQDSFLELQREAKWYYKEGQVLQSKEIFITKWGKNYKVVQYREQMKETGEINFGNLLFHSTLICLVTDTWD